MQKYAKNMQICTYLRIYERMFFAFAEIMSDQRKYRGMWLGIISWPKIHIDYRGNSYRDIVDRAGRQVGAGGRSGGQRMSYLTFDSGF